MVYHDFTHCWEGKDSVSENTSDESWSIDVDLDEEDLFVNSGSSFQLFVAWVFDTGQNVRFCIDGLVLVLRTLCGFVGMLFDGCLSNMKFI
jgi:hypothetical protein